MSTLAYRDFDRRRAAARTPRSAPTRPRRGIIWRIFAAIEGSAQRRAEAEAGQFIAKQGGRLTDDVERQLTQRHTGRGFLPYTPPRPFPNLLAR